MRIQRWQTTLLVSLTVIVVSACKPDNRPPPKPVDHTARLSRVPERAFIVMTVDLTDSWRNMLDENFGVIPVITPPSEVRAAVSEASRLVFGFDMTRAKRITAWANPAPDDDLEVGALIEGFDRTSLPKAPIETYRGIPVFAFPDGIRVGITRDGALLGTEASIHRFLDVATGQAPAIVVDRTAHSALLGDLGPALLTATVDLGFGGQSQLPEPFNELRAGAITISPTGLINVAVSGSEPALNGVQGAVAVAHNVISSALTERTAEAKKRLSADYIVLTYAAQKWPDLARMLTPVRDGDTVRLTVDTTLGGRGATVYALSTVAGVVAGIMEEYREGRTAEARENLDRIYEGAGTYFETSHTNAKGKIIECQFPKTVVTTPKWDSKVHPCCKDGGQCQPTKSTWGGETWRDLGFEFDAPHKYVYEFRSGGTGAQAKFTATAYGDLDCDGVFSTFERYGNASETPDGRCLFRPNDAIYMDKKFE